MKKSLLRTKYTIVFALALAFFLADIAAAEPDLSIQYFSVSNRPANNIYYPGDSVNVRCEVENIGDEPSDDFTADVYADNYHIGSSSLSSGTTSFPVMCSLPHDIPVGDYSIRIEITCSNDSNPSNNSASDPLDITVAPPAPDLYVPFVSIRDSSGLYEYFAGDPVSFTVDIGNQGHRSSGSYTVEFYVGSYRIGSVNGSDLIQGDRDTFTPTCNLPHDIPVGFYPLRVIVTCPDDSNPGNNEGRASYNVKIIELESPALVIQSVNPTDGVYQAGDQITVNVIIDNTGEQSPSSCEIDFYASDDVHISENDYKIKNISRSDLTPGESHSLDTTCQFPFNIPAGYYHIGIIVTWSHDGNTENINSSSSRSVWVGPPTDLVVQSVETTHGTYMPSDKIVVYSLIKNIGERSSESYTVDYYASTDTTITTDDYNIGYVNRGDLAPDEQHSYETTCQFPVNIPVGNYYIGIIVNYPKEYVPANNVGHDNTTVELVHPAGYVCGQMKYQYKLNREYPIRHALVEIYEGDDNDDPLDDHVIGQTYTNHKGRYGIVVLNDDQSGQDIYVKVFTDSNDYPGTTSKICNVKDDIFGEFYSLESPLYPHPKDSSVIIDMIAPNSESEGAFIVYDSVIEGFHKAKTFFDVNIPEIITYWPCSEESSYYITSIGIHIAQEDRYDRDVIMHEYGHHIAEIYGFAQGSVGEDATHYWNADLRRTPVDRTDEEAMNLAYREAWASLFSVATQYGDFGYPGSGDTLYQDLDEGSGEMLRVDLESDTDAHDSPGEFFENMNCCALWDIFDDLGNIVDNNDTLSDISLSKIWTISRDYQPANIISFWNSWFQSYDYEDEIRRIFLDHDMSFVEPFPPPPPPPPPPNQAPVADAGEDQTVEQTYSFGALVRVDGSGSNDPDGDQLSYIWSYRDSDGSSARTNGKNNTITLATGTTTVTLEVSDGQLSDWDSVNITVEPTDPEDWIEE